MESFCDLETAQQEKLRFSSQTLPAPRLSFWQQFIRHAGQVAVDHTHLLPLDTLEQHLARQGPRLPCCG